MNTNSQGSVVAQRSPAEEEVFALSAEELQMIAGGECVVNNI